MKSKKYFVYLVAVLLMLTGIDSVTSEAQAAEFSESAQSVIDMSDDKEALQDYLGDMSNEERVELVKELAAGLSGKQAEKVLPPLFEVLVLIQPNNAMDAYAAALRASGLNDKVARGAVQGIIAGTLVHPSLDTEEKRLAALERTSKAVGSITIKIAESMEKNPAVPAYAIIHGAMAGIEPGEEAQARVRVVGESMTIGGVGAAAVKNKPGVSRAMMLALARLKDVELRRAAVAGVAAGAKAEGGNPAVRLLEPLQKQLVQIIPVGPAPTAPELPLPPDPEEVSPF